MGHYITQDMTHLHMSHDSCIYETWLTYIWVMTHWYTLRDMSQSPMSHDSFFYETWLNYMRAIPFRYVGHDITRMNRWSWDMSQSPMSHDETWVNHLWVMTHSSTITSNELWDMISLEWIHHVPHRYQYVQQDPSCIYEWVMSHIDEPCRIWMSHVPHRYQYAQQDPSCIYEWVMSHI